MTKATDIDELLAEEGLQGEDRHALQAVADGLSRTLTGSVPFRPEFKAKLRRRMLAEARRHMMPWYRRPAVWGTSMGVAAAVAVLAVGLSFYRTQSLSSSPLPAVNGRVSDPVGRVVLTRELELPLVTLPDEAARDGLGGPGSPDAAITEAKVYRLSYRLDDRLVSKMAEGLNFKSTVQEDSGRFVATDHERRLEVAADGTVRYMQFNVTEPEQAVTREAAIDVAQRFFTSALIETPPVEPAVAVVGKQVRLTYSPQVDGRPIVNARTVVYVAAPDVITQAEMFIRSMPLPDGSYDIISSAEAIKAAASQGGKFHSADLVYVRTPDDQAIFLQPFWRVSGTDKSGASVLRYVSALKQ